MAAFVNIKVKVPNWLDKILVFPLLLYRRLRFEHPYRRIRLTEGKFTLVDPADFYWLNKFYWLTCGKDDNLYAARVVRTPSGRLNTILMHKEILKAPPGFLVDHRNTDSLDNRRFNLRIATPSQNSCNSRRNKSNTYSKYRGVSFSKRKQKFFAAIRANGRKMWLGYFDNEIDAARAYDAAARKYHGEFARLNFTP